MRRILRTLVVVVAAAVTQGLDVETGKKVYNGYEVIRTFPDSEAKLDILKSIEDSVETWTPVSGNRTQVDLMISPKQIPLVKALLKCSNIKYSITILDLQRAIDVENIETDPIPEFKGSCSTISGMSWTRYHAYDTFVRYMECISSTYEKVVTLHNIGYSSEGKPLKLVQVGLPTKDRFSQKKAIWIDGGIHAREWISPASVTYILKEFVENSASYSDLLSKYDIYIMPSVNPDGYEYSRNYDRMWRKTRSRNYGSNCIGTDPNRNWGYEWGGKGASTRPCTETYRGAYAFSEPETAAVRDFILARHNIDMYLTFHSYGQMILYPWGYERKNHNDEDELWRMGKVAADAMGRGYTVGSAAKVLYPAAGGSDDWAKGGAGIKYSYTIELPDTGSYGFILPASQIIQVGGEAFQATKAMIQDLMTSRG